MAVPVTLEDAKRQLKLEQDDVSQDGEIAAFIADAAAWIETYTGHLLTARQVTESFRGFKPVVMRAWPVQVDAVPGVAYVNGSGEPVALPGAKIDISMGRARILPGSGHFWPFVDSQQPFTVTVRAGYEAGDIVPGVFRRAMLMLIAAYDEDREGGDAYTKAEATARRICSSFRPRIL